MIADDRDRRKGTSAAYLDGPKRDTEERSERPAIKNVDADDSDVEVPSDSDERCVEAKDFVRNLIAVLRSLCTDVELGVMFAVTMRMILPNFWRR